eukprot:11283221-Alexandrium_andersonii.AAC.1
MYRHLGSLVTVNNDPLVDAKAKAGAARGAIRDLQQVYANPHVAMHTKMTLTCSLVRTRTFYNVATWTKETWPANAAAVAPVISAYRKMAVHTRPDLREARASVLAA